MRTSCRYHLESDRGRFGGAGGARSGWRVRGCEAAGLPSLLRAGSRRVLSRIGQDPRFHDEFYFLKTWLHTCCDHQVVTSGR
eukprot:6207962-Pleurochrysis_carterae.AAC.1